MGNLRVAVGSEKGFLDPHKFKSCVINAFEMTLQAAHDIPTWKYIIWWANYIIIGANKVAFGFGFYTKCLVRVFS